MSDITARIKADASFQKLMYTALMECGTLYDGRERIVEILQGTLAKGDYQEALQLGTIHKGDLHQVSTNGVHGAWLAHTHGEEDGQKYHPPSLSDILVTIQRAVEDPTHKGISVIVTVEGFYILYPTRDLIKRLHREINYDKTLAKQIEDSYPKIFTEMKSGTVSPTTLTETLKRYNIVCEFIARDSHVTT